MSWLYFRHTLVFIILLELLSLFAWFLPWFNSVAFLVIVLVVLIAALSDLRWGLLAALVELIIGSHGYLFSFHSGSTLISLRMGIFMAVMLAWVVYVLRYDGWAEFWQRLKGFPFFKAYLWLALAVGWGVIWGLVRGNNFGYLFLDFNNWLFFLYLFPLISLTSVFQQATFQRQLRAVALASLSWLAFKTFFLLYVFSHQFVWALPELYKWVRDTRIGEVTAMGRNFYRIFLQSQIYALLGFLFFLPAVTLRQIEPKRRRIYYFTFEVLLLAVIIISFSRSFWVAWVAAVFIYLVWLAWRQRKQLLVAGLNLVGLILLGGAAVVLILHLPPQISGGDLGNLITQRTTQIEAAGSSRLNMLKPLTQAIARHPVVGSGFGTTVTYRSLDPRVLSTTAGASGEYTTYAFEWSYLDLWLKLGWLGLLIYLWLLAKILQALWHSGRPTVFSLGLGLALLALIVLNVFTPYLNHPLGIGFVLMASLLAANLSQQAN